MPLTIHKIHVTCKVVCLMAMYEQRDNNNKEIKNWGEKKDFKKICPEEIVFLTIRFVRMDECRSVLKKQQQNKDYYFQVILYQIFDPCGKKAFWLFIMGKWVAF